MKKILFSAALSLAAVAAHASPGSDRCNALATGVQKELPFETDSITRLVGATCSGETLTAIYVIHDVGDGKYIDWNVAYNITKKEMCTNPNTGVYAGGNAHLVYNDTNGNLLHVFDISPSDCK